MSYTSDDQQVRTFNEKAEDNASVYACFQLASANTFPAILNAAIKLNLFEIISKGGYMSPSEIASQLPNQNQDTARKVDRVLRFLALHSLLSCSSRTNPDGMIEKVYGLSPNGTRFVQDGVMASILTFGCHPAILKVWMHYSEDAILEGRTSLFQKVHGMPMYQYMEKDASLQEAFTKSMIEISVKNMNQILEAYKAFEGVSTLVDVGGGSGTRLKLIVSKHPTINGINFDLPQVIRNLPSYPGIKHVEGDMFLSVPRADAMMMSTILHNWTNEECLILLKNCHKSLPPNGKLIVFEFIMPEPTPRSTFADMTVASLDMIMHVLLNGMERTEEEFKALCKASGFSTFRVVCRAFAPLVIMEFSK